LRHVRGSTPADSDVSQIGFSDEVPDTAMTAMKSSVAADR
jgi:hypothetical protein